jgi:hypothetical protein
MLAAMLMQFAALCTGRLGSIGMSSLPKPKAKKDSKVLLALLNFSALSLPLKMSFCLILFRNLSA